MISPCLLMDKRLVSSLNRFSFIYFRKYDFHAVHLLDYIFLVLIVQTG